ncbi:hypothetical protein GUITHDRAFT_151488, partial [Guillardia theta CCMP2712]
MAPLRLVLDAFTCDRVLFAGGAVRFSSSTSLVEVDLAAFLGPFSPARLISATSPTCRAVLAGATGSCRPLTSWMVPSLETAMAKGSLHAPHR